MSETNHGLQPASKHELSCQVQNKVAEASVYKDWQEKSINLIVINNFKRILGHMLDRYKAWSEEVLS